MTGVVLGAGLGLAFGTGLLLCLAAVVGRRRRWLTVRVLPYVRDLPQTRVVAPVSESATRAVFGPWLHALARLIERVLGGASSVHRRLVRAGSAMSVADFRVSQAIWGMVGFAVAAVPAGLLALRAPQRSAPLFVLCLVTAALAVLLRENALSAAVSARERAMLQEFPAIAGLLALAVAAGEGPVAAMERVASRAHGALSDELAAVLAGIRTGTPVAEAFDALAARTGLPVVARFAEGVAIAVERGTPLADVLHAQAADVREAGRRGLIESGARREVLMMVPVVFLVLPTVVLFAFFPGLLGLRMVA